MPWGPSTYLREIAVEAIAASQRTETTTEDKRRMAQAAHMHELFRHLKWCYRWNYYALPSRPKVVLWQSLREELDLLASNREATWDGEDYPSEATEHAVNALLEWVVTYTEATLRPREFTR